MGLCCCLFIFRFVFSNEFVVKIAEKPELFAGFVDMLVSHVKNIGEHVDAIVGVTSRDCRGEIFASPVALRLKIPYIPIGLAGPPSDDVFQTIHTTRDGTVRSFYVF